jgi:hypothetical protein
MSFFGCGTVTIPGFVGCLDQPSRLSARMTSAELTEATIPYMISRTLGKKVAEEPTMREALHDLLLHLRFR